MHLLAVTFRARPLTPLRGRQLDLKLPIPGGVAAAPYTRGPEDLCAVPQLTVCVNLLHVGNGHAFISAAKQACMLAGLRCRNNICTVESMFRIASNSDPVTRQS